MAATTEDRNTARREGEEANHPVAAATKINAGTIVVLNAAGDAEEGTTATGLKAIGRAEEAIDNSAGAAGDLSIQARKGVFQFANDGSVNRTHLEATCYIVDDQTVAATDGTGTRSAAGKVFDVDSDGVWVEFS